MTPRKITLEAWRTAEYGNDGPTMDTVRRWAREGNIQPPPEKHGRTYYVCPSARYTVTGAKATAKRLIERINDGSKTTQHAPARLAR